VVCYNIGTVNTQAVYDRRYIMAKEKTPRYTAEELDELATVYMALTEQKNDIEKELKRRREELIGILDECKLPTTYHKIKRTEGHRTTFDSKRFAAEHPRLAPKYTSVSTYDILKVL